ncbi:hypothetical protein DRP07_02770 [Archaeoglobales archaeon]|nr:MAG: hypothetical protein DRP07_02770 [Archaeoglobales archaeon]
MKKEIHKCLKILGAIVILILLTGISQSSDWPMFQHDLGHTGYTDEKVPDKLELIWSYETRGYVSSPAVANGKVFFGTYEGKGYNLAGTIYALDEITGRLIWTYKTGDYIPSSSVPAVANGKVFIGDGDGNFYALDENTGKLIWRYKTGHPLYSSPAVANGKVFISSNYGEPYAIGDKIYALEEDTGKLVWSYEIKSQDQIICSPAVANGKVFVTLDNKIYCLSENTGGLIWMSKTNSFSSQSSPAVANGKVFISGSGDYNIYALDENTGKLIWRYKTETGWVAESLTVANGKIFVTPSDHDIYALDENTGKLIWRYKTGGDIGRTWKTHPVIANGKVFIVSSDGKIYCLDENTGKLIQSYETGGIITGGITRSSIAIANGKIFFGSDDGNIYCFGISEEFVGHFISIASNPSDAEIYVNGYLRGKTPKKLFIPVGDNKIEIKRFPYSWSKTVSVSEDSMTEINADLSLDPILFYLAIAVFIIIPALSFVGYRYNLIQTIKKKPQSYLFVGAIISGLGGLVISIILTIFYFDVLTSLNILAFSILTGAFVGALIGRYVDRMRGTNRWTYINLVVSLIPYIIISAIIITQTDFQINLRNIESDSLTGTEMFLLFLAIIGLIFKAPLRGVFSTFILSMFIPLFLIIIFVNMSESITLAIFETPFIFIAAFVFAGYGIVKIILDRGIIIDKIKKETQRSRQKIKNLTLKTQSIIQKPQWVGAIIGLVLCLLITMLLKGFIVDNNLLCEVTGEGGKACLWATKEFLSVDVCLSNVGYNNLICILNRIAIGAIGGLIIGAVSGARRYGAIGGAIGGLIPRVVFQILFVILDIVIYLIVLVLGLIVGIIFVIIMFGIFLYMLGEASNEDK